MRKYKISKCNPKKDIWEDYGGGYSDEDVKVITKGFHNNGLFYERKNSKIIFVVTEY